MCGALADRLPGEWALNRKRLRTPHCSRPNVFGSPGFLLRATPPPPLVFAYLRKIFVPDARKRQAYIIENDRFLAKLHDNRVRGERFAFGVCVFSCALDARAPVCVYICNGEYPISISKLNFVALCQSKIQPRQ